MKKSLFTLSFFLISACSDSSESVKNAYNDPGTPSNGGMLVTASIGEPANLVPYLAADSAASSIAGHIYNSLLKYDKDLNIVGDIAESWTISADKKTISFTLKKDLHFSDGMPLTSKDVLATFNILTNPNTRTPYSGDYLMVEKAEAPTPYTFKVTYPEPFSPALSSWAGFIVLPAHIIEKEENFNETSLKTTPVGSNSYILKKWQRGQNITLSADPNTAFTAPYITTLRTRLIPDQDTQFLELKNNGVDMIGLTPVQFTRLTDTPKFKATYNKYKYLGNGYTYLGFNLQRPLFQDKRVRQALSYAAPRENIIEGLLHGQGLPMAGVFKPGTWAYNEKLTPYPYNPEKAKNLLKEAGWTDTNNDGLLDKNGTNFEFTVVTNQGNDLRQKTAVVLQQEFAKIGVKMNIRIQEWSTFLENTIRPRNFDAYIMGWSLSPEPDPYDIWHSSKTKPAEFNMVSFKNDRADMLMEKARRTFDQPERKAYLDEFQEIIHEEQPYLFLYAPYSLIALHKRVKNIEPAPAGISHNSELWYIPEQQRLYNNNTLQP